MRFIEISRQTEPHFIVSQHTHKHYFGFFLFPFNNMSNDFVIHADSLLAIFIIRLAVVRPRHDEFKFRFREYVCGALFLYLEAIDS